MNYFKSVRTDNFRGYTIEILKFLDVDTANPYFEHQISLRGQPIECSKRGFTWAKEAYEAAQGRVFELQRQAMRNDPGRTSLGATMKAIAAERKLSLNGANHE